MIRKHAGLISYLSHITAQWRLLKTTKPLTGGYYVCGIVTLYFTIPAYVFVAFSLYFPLFIYSPVSLSHSRSLSLDGSLVSTKPFVSFHLFNHCFTYFDIVIPYHFSNVILFVPTEGFKSDISVFLRLGTANLLQTILVFDPCSYFTVSVLLGLSSILGQLFRELKLPGRFTTVQK